MPARAPIVIAYVAGRLGRGAIGRRLWRAWFRSSDGRPGLDLAANRIQLAAACPCLVNTWGLTVQTCYLHSQAPHAPAELTYGRPLQMTPQADKAAQPHGPV
jgi:hypothetical protein